MSADPIEILRETLIGSRPDGDFDELERPARPHLTAQIASAVTPTRPEWIWQRWILCRALNLLVGRQGAGKTTFAAYLIATTTCGRALPGDVAREPIRVAFLSLEEPVDRLVARLQAAGADLERVVILGDVEDYDADGNPYRRRWQLPKDIAVLGSAIVEHHVSLVVVDGLGYSISGDSHNYAVVGSALAALAGEAERTGAAILGLVHPPKGSSEAVTSAIGSTAWTAIPRVAIVLGKDPGDESGARRVVQVGKSNYRMPEAGVSFVLADDEQTECGYVTGLGASNVDADAIMAGSGTVEERGERADVRRLLLELLADGPVDADAVMKACSDVASRRTVMTARKELGVVAAPRRDARGKVVGWILSLPSAHGASQCASQGVPAESLHSGALWTDQEKECVSLQECNETESGTLACTLDAEPAR